MSFFELLSGDPDIGKHLSKAELEGIFDYGYCVRHVDVVFERLGVG